MIELAAALSARASNQVIAGANTPVVIPMVTRMYNSDEKQSELYVQFHNAGKAVAFDLQFFVLGEKAVMGVDIPVLRAGETIEPTPFPQLPKLRVPQSTGDAALSVREIIAHYLAPLVELPDYPKLSTRIWNRVKARLSRSFRRG